MPQPNMNHRGTEDKEKSDDPARRLCKTPPAVLNLSFPRQEADIRVTTPTPVGW
jgi:hypothetical protein